MSDEKNTDTVQLNEKQVSKEELEREKEKAEKEPDVTIEQTGPSTYKKKLTG